MSDHDVTHKEIYDRLLAVEMKVDNIERNTSDVVKAFRAAEGAFVVLEFLAKLVKPVLILGAFFTAVGVIWHNWKTGH